jgi:hypothetical protein
MSKIYFIKQKKSLYFCNNMFIKIDQKILSGYEYKQKFILLNFNT